MGDSLSGKAIDSSKQSQETLEVLKQYSETLPKVKTPDIYSFEDWYNKGAGEFINGLYDKAIASFTKALGKKPNDDSKAYTYNYIGAAYGNSGRNEEALKAYRKSITLKPDNPLPHSNIAFIYLEQGHIDKAEEKIKKMNGLLEKGKLKGREKAYTEESIKLLNDRLQESKKKKEPQNEN